MNKSIKLLAVSVMAVSLIGGGTSAWASGIAKDGLKNSAGQIMTNITTYAGLGDDGSHNDENRLQATFRSPYGLLVLKDGTLLVSDMKNHLLRGISNTKVSTSAGLIIGKDSKGFPIGGRYDAEAANSVFQQPAGLAQDAAGNIYVADAGNNVIRKIDASGIVTTLAGNGLIGNKDAKGTEATFYHPQDVAVAPDGTVYVADTLNHTIRKIAADGTVTTLNAPSKRAVEVTPGQAVWGGDYLDGDMAKSKFNEPTGLAIDSKGNLFISDSGNQKIRYMDFGTGKVITVAGSSSSDGETLYGRTDLYAAGNFADGDALKAQFNYPMGIALTEEGGLLIADSLNHSVRYLHNGKVVTLAGDSQLLAGETDGIERSAQFQKPTDVAVTADGTVYIADAFSNKVRQLKVYRLPTDLPKDDNVKVVLESKAIVFDAQPEIVNDRTMIPVRAITESLGYKVSYQDNDRIVQLTKNGVTIELYLDKTGIKKIEAGKPDEIKATDTAPYIKQDRTYVPVRFFAEEVGLDVQWDNETRTVILREKQTNK
ncbi:stalk domain-containing protein [Paenibacillus sp. UNC451MF]|uniref:stalk domain-containing protein n=1 Tax=Paenibacillus sp. UNC451MF TaxID=1449063 RepID=UPI00048E4D34|nr:stalk domain-containing protein [Paenibacillus sp. UNC451MF]